LANFLTSWGTFSFSGRTRLRGIIWFAFICECHWIFMWGIAWSVELFKIWGVMVVLPKVQFVFWYYTVSCVTGQIVSVFQKLIAPWKHC